MTSNLTAKTGVTATEKCDRGNLSARLTTDCCPYCQKTLMLVSTEGRRCINCRLWMMEDTDVLIPFVVARALITLLNHGFGGHCKTEEFVSRKGHTVPQHRIDLFLPTPGATPGSNLSCEVSWFYLPEVSNYRYLNNVSRKQRQSALVPRSVQAASAELSLSGTNPGSLRFTQVDLNPTQNLNWLRMEQSYSQSQDAMPNHWSLILRVAFAWANTAFASSRLP